MSDTHTQCRLRKGNVHQTSWIPTDIAIEGQKVNLQETRINAKGLEEKYWDEGWEVVKAGGQVFPSKYIAERERDWKNTRKASDI